MANVQFNDNSIQIKQEINQKSLAWLEEIASELEAQVKKNTRTDTGNTKRDWQHYTDSEKGESYIGNPDENAVWEEFGTGEYAVNGDGRKTPWYVPVEKVLGHKKPTYNGKVEIVYGKNGMAYYKTDGKKPNRALTKAFESVKAKALKRAETIFKELGK